MLPEAEPGHPTGDQVNQKYPNEANTAKIARPQEEPRQHDKVEGPPVLNQSVCTRPKQRRHQDADDAVDDAEAEGNDHARSKPQIAPLTGEYRDHPPPQDNRQRWADPEDAKPRE